MLERIIEMVKGRNEELFVAFLDMEKAYDLVNRKKLFEVMRCYGVGESGAGWPILKLLGYIMVTVGRIFSI